ncbi:hypothetical protein SALBM217S_05324 [Streptomyces griseoloalbus]
MLGHTDALLGYLKEAEANHMLGSDRSPSRTWSAA